MSTESEDVAMIIREWLAPKHVKAKTRYTKKQVIAVSILQSLADTYNIKTLKRFLIEFKTAKLSEDGQSSSELEGILKARIQETEDVELKKLSKGGKIDLSQEIDMMERRIEHMRREIFSSLSPMQIVQAFSSSMTDGDFVQPIRGWRDIPAPSKLSPFAITAWGLRSFIAHNKPL
jgi:hypothetical protein